MAIFRDAAMRHLGSRLEPDGFLRTADSDDCLRWARRGIFVQISRDGARAGEVMLIVGQLNDAGEETCAFRLDELRRLHGDTSAGDLCAQCGDDATADSVVRAMADDFIRAAGRLLLDDVTEFSALEALRRRESASYSLERRLATAREAARTALERGAFDDYVDALLPLREHLTEAEVRRLEWARARGSRPKIDRPR
jgi:hypothetical protein